ncbi:MULTISPECIES: SDR family NAD(P)-dependent oxidoreductase [Lactiplantibacillus]|uniref:SDR family NAD(P)-dependent oxidoreductase n=1 Tax=Lactiplantibacillus TaxID=2767842 RepID=UPI0020A6F643|nr:MULTISPECIES: SDR family NAD(P)-dependent oxidoreductase [Lactiplantibacillus]
MTNKIVTLVTGGNRGMGLALIKALHAQGQQLIMGSRDLAKGRAAVEVAHLSDVTVVQLDVTDSQSIQAAVNAIQNQYGQLDIFN